MAAPTAGRLCPVHDDHDPSLSIDVAANGKLLLKCHSEKCSNSDIIAKLQERGLWPKPNGHQNGANRGERKRQASAESTRKPLGTIVKTYSYTDEQGIEGYQTVRFEPKDFRQRRQCADCAGQGCGNCKHGWVWNLKGVRRLLYRLPDIIKSAQEAMPKGIVVCEGEKDVESIEQYGFIATTNAEGAEKWHDDFNSQFNGRKAVIFRDNDVKGERHALIVARNLKGHATEIRIVCPPGVDEKGDITDWIEKRKAAGDDPQQIRAGILAMIAAAPAWKDEEKPATSLATEIEAPAWSEDAIAAKFVAAYGAELRYVAAWGKWMQWQDKGRWGKDETLYAFNRVREICRIVAHDAYMDPEGDAGPKVAKSLASARTVAAVEKLAASDRQIAATVDQWDADPWLLNTEKGVVDLKTGKLQPHRRDQYYSKITAEPPDEYADCPKWLAFLDRIMRGDDEMIAFLKRVTGYCLTGRTTEQSLFFCYGAKGANGKGVLMNTMKRLMGEYATSTAMETLTVSRGGEHHPTEVADLKGARLVITTETGEGRWNEGRIKQFTGGDPIKARYMHQNFFEFEPNFKLWISGNQEPRIRNLDVAMRRRLHVIPFTERIPDEEQDKLLADHLRSEWGSILRWAIDGCLEWQRVGLQPPAAVIGATGEYFENEDLVGQWVRSECDLNAEAATLTANLFQSFKLFAERANEFIGSEKSFSQRLASHGFERDREGGTGSATFRGLRLKAAQVEIFANNKVDGRVVNGK